MSQLNFDARSVDPQMSLEALPAGWYTARIIRSDMKPTSNKEGAFLELEMEILEPQAFVGRKVTDRLNLQNKNPTATEIAYRTLSAICHATGVIQVQDSAQLHGIPMEIRLTVNVDDTGRYDPSNDIRAYRVVNGGTGAGQGLSTGPALGQQPPGFGQPPAQDYSQQPPAQQQAPAQQWQQPANPVQNQPPVQQQPAQQPWNQPAQQPDPNQAPQQQQQQQPATQPWNQPPAEQQQPAQQQPPVQQPWNQQPQQQAPTDGQPVNGPAPSVNQQPGSPPWGQQPAQ